MTRHGLAFRQAEETDLARIVELLVLGVVPGGPPSREDPDDLGPYRDALRAIADGGGVVVVADLHGEVVGVCQLVVFRHLQARGGLCAEIESVHVHPDHRGAGVGAALMHDAIARARELGCYRVLCRHRHNFLYAESVIMPTFS
ncbi:MAG TPA: GNAT family N-acetyltransferase [Acidimicrobiales bacterium]|jgi:GNAT superfamily N-acetyltransferase|nr:GNAT family N-acetyltransferase [Acidimicrobiales bacterium]